MSLITLDMFENNYLFIPSGKVSSGGLFPCMGIFLYNTKQKNAFAGHFYDPSNGTLTNMIDEALEIYKNLNDINVYGVGNSLTLNESDKYIKDHLGLRKYVKELLNEKGFLNEKINLMWSNFDLTTEFRLNVDNGKNLLIIKKSDYKLREIFRGDYRDAPKKLFCTLDESTYKNNINNSSKDYRL